MPTNKYFNSNYYSESEQNLLEKLIIQGIQIKGMDLFYLPRELQSEDPIYGEDPRSKFTKYFEIEMYLKEVNGFGDGDLMSKFMKEITDQATFVVSRSRFETTVDGAYARPLEGDLLYFPLGKKLFIIKHVEHENPFYELGKLYTYDLKVKLYKYDNNKIEVGVPEIDSIEDSFRFSFNLVLGAGSGQYQKGETVYQGANLGSATAKGLVVDYDVDDNLLTIKELYGGFAVNVAVKGNTSLASYTVTSFDTKDIVSDPIADNKNVKDVPDVVDDDESDPFSGGNY